MAAKKRKKKKAARKARKPRATEGERLAELEARLADLKSRVRDARKFSPEAVQEERDRLELSAADYGELVGVSHLTVYNWEKGKSSPQAAQLEKWLAVKGVGKREAWRRLGLID